LASEGSRKAATATAVAVAARLAREGSSKDIQRYMSAHHEAYAKPGY
jgi:hypothetical protein